MADTIQNMRVTAEIWVEVYAFTGITPNTPIDIQNIGDNDLYYSKSAVQPLVGSNRYKIFRRETVIQLSDSDLAIWLFSPQVEGLTNVKVTTQPPSQLPTSASGDLKTIEPSLIFEGSFEYTVENTELNDVVNAGGATIIQADAMAVLSTSTTTGSSACLRSKRLAKSHARFGLTANFSTLFVAPVVGTEQFAGFLDETGTTSSFKNGLAVGYNLDGGLGFLRFNDDTLTTNIISDWIDPLDGSGASGEVLIPTDLNNWSISSSFGILSLWWEEPSGKLVLVDKIEYSNNFTVPSSMNPNYHFAFWANNGATTENITLKTHYYGVFVEGAVTPIQVHRPNFSTGLITKSGITTATTMFTIRCKDLYFTKKNFIEMLMTRFSASVDVNQTNNLATVIFVKNGIIGGAPVWVDINTTDSVAEIDINGIVTGGKLIVPLSLSGRSGSDKVDISDENEILLHGETVSAIATSASSATISVDGLHKELF